MKMSKMKNVRQAAVFGALTATLWCAQAGADVLEQAPVDAVGVLKISNLGKLSDKVAKLSKTFGLDQLSPDMKDPLGAALDKAKMSKGVNKDSDAALLVYTPDKQTADPEPAALVPVSDYTAFLSNFEKADEADAGDGVSAVKDPDGGKTLYVAHHGAYAMVSDSKKHLSGKVGMKVSAMVMKEADAKDVIFIVNMPVAREKAVDAIKEHRKEIIDEMDKGLGEQEALKPYIPVFDTVVNHALDVAGDFLHDAQGIAFSMNVDDKVIGGSALVEFAPGSKFGKTVASLKSDATPLLAGLPDTKYFVLAGASVDPKTVSGMLGEWVDPVIKSLQDTNTDASKKIATALESMKTMAASSSHTAFGMIMPTKPMGQESLIQEVGVVNGDAKAIADSQKTLLTDMSDLMALAPQNKGVKTSVVFGEPKTIDGATLQTYSTKLEFDKNDPQGMQAEQILAMIYGPNGVSGAFGPADDKTFVVAQGASDEVIKELLTSAKAGKDVLGADEAIKATTAMLPPHPTVVYYVALDNMISTGVRYAQGFGLQVKLKLPQNLAPVGVAVGADGSTLRVDGVLPVDTVQALISAGLQAYTDMQQGGKAGGL